MSKLTDEDLLLGGFRFEDLVELKICSNRTDLGRKQAELKFPKPVKTGASQAMFLKSEVFTWLRKRAALRDAPEPIEPPAVAPAATPPRKRGRPREDAISQTTPPPVVPEQPKAKVRQPARRRTLERAR